MTGVLRDDTSWYCDAKGMCARSGGLEQGSGLGSVKRGAIGLGESRRRAFAFLYVHSVIISHQTGRAVSQL